MPVLQLKMPVHQTNQNPIAPDQGMQWGIVIASLYICRVDVDGNHKAICPP